MLPLYRNVFPCQFCSSSDISYLTLTLLLAVLQLFVYHGGDWTQFRGNFVCTK